MTSTQICCPPWPPEILAFICWMQCENLIENTSLHVLHEFANAIYIEMVSSVAIEAFGFVRCK